MSYIELLASGWPSPIYKYSEMFLKASKLRLWYIRTIRRMKMKALKEEERCSFCDKPAKIQFEWDVQIRNHCMDNCPSGEPSPGYTILKMYSDEDDFYRCVECTKLRPEDDLNLFDVCSECEKKEESN